MTTYTIAFTGDMLIATVPDGANIDAAVREYEAEVGGDCVISDYETEEGLTLTDDEPDDRDRIIWNAKGGHGGFLMVGDAIYNYAVR